MHRSIVEASRNIHTNYLLYVLCLWRPPRVYVYVNIEIFVIMT